MNNPTMNRRPYDMQNDLLRKIIGSIIAPVIVIGIVSLVGLQIKQAFDSGVSVHHQKSVDKKLDSIQIEIKENRLERVNSYNKLYDYYEVLNNNYNVLNNNYQGVNTKFDTFKRRADIYWPETKRED